MSGREADGPTLGFYDRESAAYAEWSAPEESPWLAGFIAMTPEDGRLLDYGCGGGWAAARMLAAGRRVDAFDGSARLAEEASRRAGINVRVMRFESLDAEARYDGVWASFCLLHAPRAAMPGNLARIARALKPGGAFYLGLKRGAGEARDTLGRFYVYYEAEEIRALLAAAGFTAIDLREATGESYSGDPDREMHLYSRKTTTDG